MALEVGTRLGHYDVTALIGEGGMGQVYQATDTKLNRQVALKILPEAFATDPDRLARFQREAQVLASLNHPNIAQIHGLEESGDTRALVLELVEGPTLADRIAHGAIPLDEALPIAKQIAEALEAAHEAGVIHRDLKPANIKVRDDGTVKVLDFGLAKALDTTPQGDPSLSPTLTAAATQMGVIMGTAAYMSPEQARGKVVDKRADIWALGCVLFEMLSGRPPFTGDTVSETLADVMKSQPPWQTLPASVPASLHGLIRRCLVKEPRQRIRDIGDARLALEGAFETPALEAPATPGVAPPAWRRASPPVLALIMGGLLVSGVVWSLWPPSAPLAVTRFALELPAGTRSQTTSVMAFSRDGRQVVFNTSAGLYLRSMDALGARLVPGTEARLANPFFSPDGESIGFFQEGQLKRIAVGGGPPVVIGPAENPFGATWEADGTILVGQATGILRVAATGGTPEVVIAANDGELMYGPQLLPGGAAVLFSVTTGLGPWDDAQVVAQSLSTGERTVLVRGGSDARYLPTGHLIYARGDGLFGVAFDADRLTVRGGPVPLVQGVRRGVGARPSAAANYGVSDEGTLVYVSRSAGETGQPPSTLVWVDRAGQETPIPVPPRPYAWPRLSPDGTRVAVSASDLEENLWLWDLARATLTRLTFERGPDRAPIWTPDGQRLVFSSLRAGPPNLYEQAADGTGPATRLTESPNAQYPTGITADGTRVVLYELPQTGGAADLGLLTRPVTRLAAGPESGVPDASPSVETLLGTQFAELGGVVSPDGRWLAYQADSSGRFEIYVRPFPNVGDGQHQVSNAGGKHPLWARSGQELFFVAPDGALMTVPVEPRSTTWSAATATKLVEGRYFTDRNTRQYDVSPDGQRFLMIKEGSGTDQATASASLIVVQNWFEELKRLVPAN